MKLLYMHTDVFMTHCILKRRALFIVCARHRLILNVFFVQGETLPGAGEVYDRVICDVPCSGDGSVRKDR